MKLIFKLDSNLCLTIEDELYENLNEYITEDSAMLEDAFDMLSIVLNQPAKIVVGETEEGDYIVFEEDTRILN